MNTTACVLFGFGCSRSEVEAARLIEYLKKNRWLLTRDIRNADLILLGTCGVTRLIEELSIALVSTASRRKRLGSKIIVFGCMPAMNEARLKENFDVKLRALAGNIGQVEDRPGILSSALPGKVPNRVKHRRLRRLRREFRAVCRLH